MDIRGMRLRYLPSLVLVAAVLLTSSLASATVVVSGQLTIPNPIPTSLADGAYTSSSLFYIIPEVSNVIAPQSIPGGYIGGTIPAGTVIDAYIIHADSPSVNGNIYSGSVTFDTPILGIYVSDSTLNFSDTLAHNYGSPILTYPTDFPNRGLELTNGGTDSVVWSPDHRTVTVTFNTSGNSLDEMRLIVATPTPEPASIGMAGLGLASLGLVMYRRRRA